MPSCTMEPRDCTPSEDDIPQAMAFTVTFDSAKTSNNKFIKRHIRNLSLPIAKIYDNKVGGENTLNGKPSKKQGNHSEGYFSSDAEEDNLTAKLNLKLRNGGTRGAVSIPKVEQMGSRAEATSLEEEEGGASDVASETGTYTIERESPEVITARLSIDANFGVHHTTDNISTQSWINEWATQVVTNHKSPMSSQSEPKTSLSTRPTLGTSKIPSPVTSRARLGSTASSVGSRGSGGGGTRCKSDTEGSAPPRFQNRAKEECSDSSLETESYLKTTEKLMSTLAARMSVSLDSGGESDCGGDASRSQPRLHHSDSSASESSAKPSAAGPPTSTRYNRAFSLRRGRLEESSSSKKPAGGSGSGGGGGGAVRRAESCKPMPPAARTKVTTPLQPQGPTLSRGEPTRLSMRAKQPPAQVANQGAGVGSNGLGAGGGGGGKKKVGGGRSNSTLSSKEVEFQNWKRRKSYDPMKAAAEGKKKEAAKRAPTSSASPPVMTQSTTNAATTPKSPVNSVLRSASFHGTRQLGGGVASSSEEEEEMTLSAEDDDWPVPQAPKTSLENTPRGSRVSLYSNNSNTSPRSRHKLEGVDNLVVSAIYGISTKLKGSASSLLKKLRYLYDEESEKCKKLSGEIDELDNCEGGSPQKSPSKELASTLRNLKRIEASLRLVDDVLFDEAEYK